MSEDIEGKWWVSDSEEWFSCGPFDSREDAISEGREVYPQERFYVGQSAHLLNLAKPDIDAMLERLDEEMSEYVSFDGPLIELSKENTQKLEDIVSQFLRDNATITNFSIPNAELIEAEEEANDPD